MKTYLEWYMDGRDDHGATLPNHRGKLFWENA